MKRVTASEARRNWFRILDEVAAGAVVVVERSGRRILIQREEGADPVEEIPDYDSVVSGCDLDHADEWGWAWEGPEGEVSPTSAGDETRETGREPEREGKGE